nr:SAM-dependent methyltransferase [Lachnospiraceae bacterium]
MNKESFLKPGERLDDLQRNGLYIIQQPKGFCFGMDAVLLSGFAGERTGQNTKNILDLCTGNGIIPLLLSAKTDAKYIVGMEIQPDVAEMAKRSVK